MADPTVSSAPPLLCPSSGAPCENLRPAPEIPPAPPFPAPREKMHRRWDRIGRLLGDAAMARLATSHVAVFGLGGVGSYAVEGLARSAVGRLSLVDFDVVCATNQNRQLHALKNTVGQPKAELMAARVRAINPDAWVRPVHAFYEARTAAALLDPRPDFVVDAIDNITAKLHLLATCHREGIPVVSSMGAAAKVDPTQVRVCDLSETHTDPLARVLRKNLGSRYGIRCERGAGPVGISAVFSAEPVAASLELAYDRGEGFRCVCPHQADSPHGCEERSVIYGTAGFVTSVFGMTAASVVVRGLTAARP